MNNMKIVNITAVTQQNSVLVYVKYGIINPLSQIYVN